MKLLFDEFPHSTHVALEQLDTATDRHIWDFAGANGYVVVSKDSDFRQLAFLHGTPPKAVWLRVGNQPTRPIADLLRSNVGVIEGFCENEDEALLVLPDLGPALPASIR